MQITPKLRLTALCLVPILISCIGMASLISAQSNDKLDKQADHFLQSLTSYLAMTSVQYLVNEDLLGLNVTLNQMKRDEVIDFASVYDVNDQLLAQVGERRNQARIFSQQIVFQDTTAGYIQVGYSHSKQLTADLLSFVLVFHAGLALFALLLIWLVSDLVAIWVLAKPNPETPNSSAITSDPVDTLTPELPEGAVLVVKLEPARLQSKHQELITGAINVYSGKTLESHADDFAAVFNHDNAGFSSACAALLIQTLIARLGPPLKAKIGLHWSTEMTDEVDESDLKHTRYLASISSQTVLASRKFSEAVDSTSVSLDPHRSSLSPDGEVFEVREVTNQSLIDSQADQLLNRN